MKIIKIWVGNNFLLIGSIGAKKIKILQYIMSAEQNRTPVMASSVDNTTIQTINTIQAGESSKKSNVKDSIELKEGTKEILFG